MKRVLKRALSLILTFTLIFSTCVFAGMKITTLKASAAAGALKVDENGDFTILQIADVQGCYPLPEEWLNTIRLAVSVSEPDLIVMTGDNVICNGYSSGVWHTFDEIVSEFVDIDGNPIPFTVTFGNHDTESNSNDWSSQDFYKYLKTGKYDNGNQNRTVAKGYKGYYSDDSDFSGYTNFVDYDKSSSISGLNTMGTGYIDVYDATGSTVVERVILINSGTYDDNGGYGKPGYNTTSSYNNDTAYNNLVSAVDSWTSNANIKCIAFQHIPLREFYGGDSDSTKILKMSSTQTNSSYLKGYTTSNTTITNNYYAPNTGTNSTVSGIYTEQCCCSYGDTSALYNALAKDNVCGIFYGHDHGNTLTGVTTIDGKSLRQGYGGGINTEYNGAGVSMFSYYTLNSAYSGPTDDTNFEKTSDDYTSFLSRTGATYGPKTYAPSDGSVSYIGEVIVDYAPHGIFQARTFDNAVDNLEDDDYIPIRTMYNDSDANADLNRSTGSYTDDIAIGYKTTTNPENAITGLIGYRTSSSDHPESIDVELQNGYVATYYLEDNDVDCSAGISDYYTLLYYTRDEMVGPPITNIYVSYDSISWAWSQFDTKTGETIGDYNICSWVKDDLDGLKEWQAFDFNTGCGSDTNYIYVEDASHGTEDVTRKYYDMLNVYEKYGKVYDSAHERYTVLSYQTYCNARADAEDFIDELTGSPYSSSTNAQIQVEIEALITAYNQLAELPEASGKQVKVAEGLFNDFAVAVPETIYLVPNATSSTVGQFYLNNKIDSSGNLVADGSYTGTGTFEITCDNAYDIEIEVARMKGTTFDANGSTTNYYGASEASITANVTYLDDGLDVTAGDGITLTHSKQTSNYDADKLAGTISASSITTGLAPGSTSLLEWRFTVTRANGTEEKVYAYTTLYSPYVNVVASGAQTMQDMTKQGVITGIYGIHEVLSTSYFTDIYIGTDKRDTEDGCDGQGTYSRQPLVNNSYTPGTWQQDGAPTDFVSGNTNGGFSYFYRSSNKDTNFAGSVGIIYFDNTRAQTISQIPNLGVFVDQTGIEDESEYHSWESSGYDGRYYIVDNVPSTSQSNNVKSTSSQFVTGYVGTWDRTPKHWTLSCSSDTTTIADGYSIIVYGYVSGRWKADNIWHESDSSKYAKSYTSAIFKESNKSSIRTAIGTYEKLSPQFSWYDDSSKVTAYYSALAAASLKLGNPGYKVLTSDETTLSTAFNNLTSAEKRTDTINGVANTKLFTTEQNYSLECRFDGFNRIGYKVSEDALSDTYKFEGRDINNDGVADGISTRETLQVKPYSFADSGYNYIGWMDGEGYRHEFVKDPDGLESSSEGALPLPGDNFTSGMLGNLYEDFGTGGAVNYGHLTADMVESGANEFYFYYQKPWQTLTFDLDGGQFTYAGTTYTSWSVNAFSDDVFTISIIPTKAGYVFDGWELVEDSDADGSFNPDTSTYTYGQGTGDSYTTNYAANDTLKAKWLKISYLYIDSNGGSSANNLLYFHNGAESMSYSSTTMSWDASYNSDSTMNITGSVGAHSGEYCPTFDNYFDVYLVKGHTYEITYTCTNNGMDFYLYKQGTSMGCRSGRLKSYKANSDGTYTSTSTFTVGGTGTDGGDRTWDQSGYNNDSYVLSALYNFRISVASSVASTDFTISNLKIVEASGDSGVDNYMMQYEQTTRYIQSPEEGPDEKVFGGWEVYTMNGNELGTKIGDTDNPTTISNYLTQSGDNYVFTYSADNIGLKAMWIYPIGVSMDNMFNYYDWRYTNDTAKLNNQATSGDTITLSNANQTITVESDGVAATSGTGHDIYTGYDSTYDYRMPLYVDGNGNTVYNYIFEFDLNVTQGNAQYFLFGYKDNASTQATSWILKCEYPGATSGTVHKRFLVTASSDTANLRLRFGVSQANSKAVYSNIRIVPVSVSSMDNIAQDTYGYYNQISNEQTVTYNTAKYATLTSAMLYTPTRTGYTFNGWTKQGESDFVKVRTVIEDDLYLWSNWTINSNTLVVKPNTGTWNGKTTDQTFTQNYNTTLSVPKPTKTGYTFTGWTRTNTNGTLSSLTDDATYTFGPPNGTTDTITAGWEANKYKIGFDNLYYATTSNPFNGGTYDSSTQTITITHTNGATVTSSESYVYTNVLIDVEKSTQYVISADYTMSGADTQMYCFFKTSTGASCSIDNTDVTALVSNIDGESVNKGTPLFTSNGNHYFVVTTPSDCEYIQLRIDCNNGNANTTGTVTVKNIHVVDKAVSNDSEDVRTGVTYTAQDKTVTYDSTYGDLITPTRTGYTFIGWNTKPDGSGTYITSTDKVAILADTCLYSQWSADEFVLVFDKNSSDTIASMPINSSTSNSTWSLIYDNQAKATVDGVISSSVPTDSTTTGKIFMGWNTKADGSGTAYYPGDVITRAQINQWYSDIGGKNKTQTLYAQWYDATDALDAVEDGPETNQSMRVVYGVKPSGSGYARYNSSSTGIYEYNTTKYNTFDTARTNFNNAKTNLTTYLSDSTKTASEKDEYVSTYKSAVDALKSAWTTLSASSSRNSVNVSYLNNFYITNASGKTKHSLAEMNLNHYTTATLDDAKTALANAYNYAYSNITKKTKRKAFDKDSTTGKTYQELLNSAVYAMANDFVNTTNIENEASYKVYETKSAMKLLTGSDVDAVNYVMSGSNGYTYYCYTNSATPTIGLLVNDDGTKVSYPTRSTITSSTGDEYSRSVKEVTNSQYSTYIASDIGDEYTGDINGTSYTGTNYYNKQSMVELTPTLSGDRDVAIYQITSYDDSLNANYANKSALSSSPDNSLKDIQTISNNTTVTPENTITIVVNYKPKGSFDVTGDQWGDHDKWLKQFHLYRTSGGAYNWEIHGVTANDKSTSPINLYSIVDPQYDQENYCSFIYTFEAASTTDIANGKVNIDTTNVNSTANLSTVRSEIQKAKTASGKTAYNYIKDESAKWSGTNSGGTGLGFLAWPGSKSWSLNYYPKSNSYTYVHLIDRWGNSVDKIIAVPNLDSIAANMSTASVGSYTITESGGSGIDTLSLNSSTLELIADENSVLVGDTFMTTGNTLKLYTGEANKTYTLTMNDNATNASTASVKTDADGYIVMEIDDTEYTDGVYSFELNGYSVSLYSNLGKVVDVDYEKTVGTVNTYDVKVLGRANMLQFIELDKGNGTGTRSFDRYHKDVTITSYNESGEQVTSTARDIAYEIWTVKTNLANETIGARVKEAGSYVWESMEYVYEFENEYADVASDVISAKLASESGKAGPVSYTITTGKDATGVQLVNEEGETFTLGLDKATVNEDETLTFKGTVWFHGTGTRTATVKVRDIYGWEEATTLEYEINQ